MKPEQDLDDPDPRNVAFAVGALAAIFLIVAAVFLVNSPVADREAVVSTDNPSIATLHCGRPLLHDEDALRERRWSATPKGRGTSAVTGEDVVLCRELVDGHRTRAWVSGGIGLLVAGFAVVVSRRRPE